MELPGFLRDHADPDVADRLPSIRFDAGGKLRDDLEVLGGWKAHAAERVDELVALGDGLIAGPKGYAGARRVQHRRAVPGPRPARLRAAARFATFSTGRSSRRPLRRRGGGVGPGAQPGMAEFCAGDERLIGVGATTLDDPVAAVAEVEHIASLGLGAVWVPHRAGGGRSPGHDDLDPFWAAARRGASRSCSTSAATPLQIDPAWMNTGRPVPGDWLGGGENVRGKDMIGLHHGPERFVGAMVLDGVLERHRDLRVGVIELGAGWVPAMLRRLDHIVDIWRQSEPDAARRSRRSPSEQITEQVAFTPFPFEDVGALIRESDPRAVPVQQRLPARRGRPQPARAVRAVARGVRRRRARPVLQRQPRAGCSASADPRGRGARPIRRRPWRGCPTRRERRGGRSGHLVTAVELDVLGLIPCPRNAARIRCEQATGNTGRGSPCASDRRVAVQPRRRGEPR